jgi:hypothetical protein
MYMSSERLPNEEDIQRVSSVEESHNHYDVQEQQGEGHSTTSTFPPNMEENNAENVVPSSNDTNEEKSILSNSNSDQVKEADITDQDKGAKEEQQIIEQDTVKQEQKLAPTMSPEHVLLLQLLRRAKRQQDLVIEVQKNLKSLINIQKGIEKTTEQLKHLQSVVKDSQKQITQVQRQISTVERAQEKEFAKLRTQKRGRVVISTKGKTAKNREKRKKTR